MENFDSTLAGKIVGKTKRDEDVQRKIELFPTWYNSQTSNYIIQGIGRGVRNKTDWSHTYILDGCFSYLYNITKQQYSPELQKRIKFI